MDHFKTIQIGDYRARFFDTKSSLAVLFLPGTNAEVFDGRYDYIVQGLQDEKYSVLMPEIWKNSQDLDDMTIEKIYSSLSDAVSFLKKSGVQHVIGIGKSFGAVILLTSNTKLFNSLILLAPPIILGSDNFFDKFAHTKLKNISLPDLTISSAYLQTVSVPTKFVLGTSDEVVSLEMIENASLFMPDGIMSIIEGADHSFSNEVHENMLVDIIHEIVHSFSRKNTHNEKTNYSRDMET